MDDNTHPKPSDTRGSRSMTEHTFHPLRDLQSRIESLFDDFYRGGSRAPFARLGWGDLGLTASDLALTAALPSLDVIDKEDELKVVAELPGMAEGDIDIQVNESTLTLSGEKKEEVEEGDKEGEYYTCERRFGSFRRTIRLPKGIDQEKVEATFKNGVLTVHLPKKPEAQHPSRKVEVKAKG